MKNLKHSWTLIVAALGLGLAVNAAGGPVAVVQSKLSSVDDAIHRMVVSEQYTSKDPRVISGMEPGDFEAELIADFQTTGPQSRHAPWREFDSSLDKTALKNRFLLNARYGYTMANHLKLFGEGIQSGLGGLTLLTDSGTSMDSGPMKEGEKFHTDVTRATPKASEAGDAIKSLLRAGATYGGSNYGIYFSPFYPNDNQQKPLMHLKNLVFHFNSASGPVSFCTSGTANLNSNPRYNRLVSFLDPEICGYIYRNALAMRDTFGAGGTIKDIKGEEPLTVQYGDGTSVELGFTDGRRDLNLRFSNFLTELLTSGDEPEEIVFSEFVFTDSDSFKALTELKKKFPNLKIRGVLDQKFVGLVSFGLGAAFSGYDVDRPMGPPVNGWNYELRKNVELKTFLRAIDGRKETDEDGAPINRWLWHDKTAMVTFKRADGSRWTRIATGSFNLSNHYQSAEFQGWYLFKGDSPWVAEFRNSILEVADRLKDYVIPIELGIFRELIAKLTGRGVLEVSNDFAASIADKIKQQDLGQAFAELKRLALLKSDLENRPPPAVLVERLARLQTFGAWFETYKAAKKSSERWSVRKMVSAGKVLAYESVLSPVAKRELLETVVWESALSKDEAEVQGKDAWLALYGDLAQYPVPKPRVISNGSNGPIGSQNCDTGLKHPL